MMVEQKDDGLAFCKYCGLQAVVKFGKYKGVQRYYCKVCRRKYKSNDCLFHMKMPIAYVSSVFDMYYKGMTVFEIIKYLRSQHDYYPNKSLIYTWINKYTELAIKYLQDYHPISGDTWMINETLLAVGGRQKVYIWDVIDERTQYLLSSNIFIEHNKSVNKAIKEAIDCAGRKPRTITINKYCNRIGDIKRVCNRKTILLQKTNYRTTDLEARFTITFNGNTQSGRPFKNLTTLIRYNRGWSIYYNYFKPNRFLGKRTPADESRIHCDINNWHELLLRL